MRGNKRKYYIFVTFFLLSILVLIFAQFIPFFNLTNFVQSITIPVQRLSMNIFSQEDNSDLSKLKDENSKLRAEIAKLKGIQEDNKAFRDQFGITKPAPESLVPAYIIGRSTFLPNVTSNDEIIIDKGSENKVKTNYKIVYRDNLLGKVSKVSPNASVVKLLNNSDISIAVKTLKTDASGIIKGTGDKKMILENVSLNDVLKVGDTIITKDPEPLVIGKIISVNKKASSLFQSAEVESLINPSRLKMVFVLKNKY